MEFKVAFQTSMYWMRRCNIVMGDNRTFDLAGRFIPQLREALRAVGHEKSNSAVKCQLDQEHLNLIKSLTEAERMLFDAVRQRVEYLLTH
jgi:hypothetical protein